MHEPISGLLPLPGIFLTSEVVSHGPGKDSLKYLSGYQLIVASLR
jgi:hypothetical protein